MISGLMLRDCSPVSCQLWSTIYYLYSSVIRGYYVCNNIWMAAKYEMLDFERLFRNSLSLTLVMTVGGTFLDNRQFGFNFSGPSHAENERKSKVFFGRGLQMYHARALWAKYNLRSYNFTVRRLS